MQRQVRFNGVPEKVPEKVWEASVQPPVRFNRVPEKVPEKVPDKVLEKVPGGFGAAPGQVQQGSGQGSGEGLGGFGAEAGEVQQGSGEGSGEGFRKPCCKAESGSMGPEKVAEQVPAMVLGIFGAGPGQDRVSSAWLRSTLRKDF